MEQLCNHSFIPTEVNNVMEKILAAEGNIVTIHANHQITPNTHIFAYRFDQNKINKNWYIITNAKNIITIIINK
jgi:predicted SnoaL-like aldol condensation-catalyzing enzyme